MVLSNVITNALSVPRRNVVKKNSLAASCSNFNLPRMLVLVSKTSATDNGRFVSLLKFERVWALSSSKTLKSSFGSRVMSLPLLSATVNITFTRSTLTDKICELLSDWPGSAVLFCCAGRLNTGSAAQIRSRRQSRIRVIEQLERFINLGFFPRRRNLAYAGDGFLDILERIRIAEAQITVAMCSEGCSPETGDAGFIQQQVCE